MGKHVPDEPRWCAMSRHHCMTRCGRQAAVGYGHRDGSQGLIRCLCFFVDVRGRRKHEGELSGRECVAVVGSVGEGISVLDAIGK